MEIGYVSEKVRQAVLPLWPACAYLALLLLVSGCGKSDHAALLSQSTPLEKSLDEAFGAIDADNAEQLYSLTSQEERREEGLTPEKLGKVLTIFRRETEGASHGSMVISGDSGLLGGTVTYRTGKRTLTDLGLVSRPDASGRPTVNVVDGLVRAADFAHSIRAGQDGSGPVTAFQALLSGLQALKPEYAAAGLTEIYRGGNSARGYVPRVVTENLDQEEDRLEKQIAQRKARLNTRRTP